MLKQQYLPIHQSIFKNKTVLDLGCHSGESTKIIHNLGACHTFGIDIRENLIAQAKQYRSADNIEYFSGDITDSDFLSKLVAASETVNCLGVLYHLFDHFRFFSQIFKPNIEHVLFETEYGSESLNPEMFWGFETTDHVLHGWAKDLKIIPNGTPNLSWILQAASIFGFECDWIHCYGRQLPKSRKQVTMEEYLSIASSDWPKYEQLISDEPIPKFVEQQIQHHLKVYTNRRMILRLFNTKLIDSKPLNLKTIYQWPSSSIS